MSTTENIHVRISDYLEGSLSETDAREVANLIASDENYKTEYENIMLVNDMMLSAQLSDIQEICNDEFNAFQKRSKLKKYLIASVAIVGVAGSLLLWSTSSENDEIETSQRQEIELPKVELESTQETIEAKTSSIPEEEITLPDAKEIDSLIDRQTPTDSSVASTVVDTISDYSEEPKIVLQKDTAKEMITAEKVVIDCTTDIPQWTLSASETCKGEEDGEVTLVSSDEKRIVKEAILNADGDIFNNSELAVGSYTYAVTDDRACEYSKPFEITAKLCPVHYKLTPAFGESLDFSDKEGILTVTTQSGEIYFQSNLEEMDNWDGRNIDQEITYGYFLFTIEQDGKQIEFGSITIIR